MVQISYDPFPLECKTVTINPKADDKKTLVITTSCRIFFRMTGSAIEADLENFISK
ncbi:hypothetical protein KIN20_023562 [Parelaphostrongylus tenuis]|uniref:Uncharacterized protein n=1 Tax=Parelaphostrongylus tenuis TaxID=148309 RepID=A0AAD5MS67_PARTN|nr:hypothetical protein KIN20_023562 [Parelaphostrongylus tenuis]